MKNKRFIVPIIFLISLGLFLPNPLLKAQTGELPFGGIASFEVVCSCTPGLLWIWFTPLYLGGPVVITGPMVYSPFSTILYGYYHIGVPGIWHLGSYIEEPETCWIEVDDECVLLPSVGLMTKVGTNY